MWDKIRSECSAICCLLLGSRTVSLPFSLHHGLHSPEIGNISPAVGSNCFTAFYCYTTISCSLVCVYSGGEKKCLNQIYVDCLGEGSVNLDGFGFIHAFTASDVEKRIKHLFLARVLYASRLQHSK